MEPVGWEIKHRPWGQDYLIGAPCGKFRVLLVVWVGPVDLAVSARGVCKRQKVERIALVGVQEDPTT
jgi:hypothetical protein